jgi:hypothetical protein
MRYIDKIKRDHKSVQSIHPCKSVIQANFDIIKAHSGRIGIGKKWKRKKMKAVSLLFNYLLNPTKNEAHHFNTD